MNEGGFDQSEMNPQTTVKNALTSIDKALSSYHAGEIGDLKFLGVAINIWNVVDSDQSLKGKAEQVMRDQRQYLHQLAGLNISKSGDPVKKRYNPSNWVGDMPKEFKGKEKDFMIDKMLSFRNFVERVGGI